MKRYLAFLYFISICFGASAQEFNADFSYKYLYSPQWDRAIQSYNFSRPLLMEKQPLLMHGFEGSASYMFMSFKKVKSGIQLSYANFGSSAENIDIENSLSLHILNIGYILRFENAEKPNGFYADLIVSATSSGLFRSVNGSPFIFDETRSKAFGIGGNACAKMAYSFKLKSKTYLSPFIALGYTPYLYSPNTEAVINQTKGLAGKPGTGILTAQAGLALRLKRE